jgi:hypothetical protein
VSNSGFSPDVSGASESVRPPDGAGPSSGGRAE